MGGPVPIAWMLPILPGMGWSLRADAADPLGAMRDSTTIPRPLRDEAGPSGYP